MGRDKDKELFWSYVFESVVVQGFEEVGVLFGLDDTQVLDYSILEFPL